MTSIFLFGYLYFINSTKFDQMNSRKSFVKHCDILINGLLLIIYNNIIGSLKQPVFYVQFPRYRGPTKWPPQLHCVAISTAYEKFILRFRLVTMLLVVLWRTVGGNPAMRKQSECISKVLTEIYMLKKYIVFILVLDLFLVKQ